MNLDSAIGVCCTLQGGDVREGAQQEAGEHAAGDHAGAV